MTYERHQSGFSLLESMLAIVLVAVAGMGVYSLFHSGMDSYHLNDASQEMVEIANVFTDLASADLTGDISGTTMVTALYNSDRLSSRYFSNDGQTMLNPFSSLAFTAANPYSFSVNVPLGCLDADSNVPDQFCHAVEDLYACGTVITSDSEGACMIYLPLTFNLTG